MCIEFGAGALAVVGRVAAFVPRQTEPAQVVFYLFGVGRFAALRVEVFDAQNPRAALRFDRQPRQQCRVNIAQVHAPRRRRCKTSAYLFGWFHGAKLVKNQVYCRYNSKNLLTFVAETYNALPSSEHFRGGVIS